MKVSALTGKHNYFEDFKVGEVLKHARGKTVEPLEQVWITNVTMNTAEAHFNEHLTQSTPYGRRLGFGGVTISMRRFHISTRARSIVERPNKGGSGTVSSK